MNKKQRGMEHFLIIRTPENIFRKWEQYRYQNYPKFREKNTLIYVTSLILVREYRPQSFEAYSKTHTGRHGASHLDVVVGWGLPMARRFPNYYGENGSKTIRSIMGMS